MMKIVWFRRAIKGLQPARDYITQDDPKALFPNLTS